MMLDKIIKSCKYVVKNSKSVKINEAKLDEFIETIKNIKTNHWLSYSPYDLLDLSTEKIINFLLVYESIDFSFFLAFKNSLEISFLMGLFMPKNLN